jgi:hypothetical protein
MMKKVFISLMPLVFSITGCHEFGGGVRGPAPYHQGGPLPPAHAPAHGRRAQYRYYYYPEARFYFDIGRNLYFYLDSRGTWAISATLPPYLRQYRHSHHVEIEMDIDKPYHRYKYHRKMYPPGQVKKKYKKNKKKKHDDDDDKHKKKGKGPFYD